MSLVAAPWLLALVAARLVDPRHELLSASRWLELLYALTGSAALV